jgi:hypothetical protein
MNLPTTKTDTGSLKEKISYLFRACYYRVTGDSPENYQYIFKIDEEMLNYLLESVADYNIVCDICVPILYDFIEFKNLSQIDINDLNIEFDIFESIYL